MSMGSGSIDSCLSLWLFKQHYTHAATCGEEGLVLIEKGAFTFL